MGVLVLAAAAAIAAGLPARDALMQEMISDTAVVESTIREVRAAPASDADEAGISLCEGTSGAGRLSWTSRRVRV